MKLQMSFLAINIFGDALIDAVAYIWTTLPLYTSRSLQQF